MSLLPYILSELSDLSSSLDDAPRRHRRWGHDLDDVLGDLMLYRRPSLMHLLDGPDGGTLVLRPLRPRQVRRQLSSPTALAHKLRKAAVKDTKAEDDGFHINVDVQQFKPEELSVQVLKDEGFVVVEGNHEERPDEHGYIRRQFTRRYKLPDNVDPETIVSRLTTDGVLRVTAPRKDALPAPKENVRHVPITQTDRPAVEHQVGDEVLKEGDKSTDKPDQDERMEA